MFYQTSSIRFLFKVSITLTSAIGKAGEWCIQLPALNSTLAFFHLKVNFFIRPPGNMKTHLELVFFIKKVHFHFDALPPIVFLEVEIMGK